VLGRTVTIREDGTERRVTAAEAFLLQLAKRGVEGNSAAARASLDLLEDAGKQQKLSGPDRIVRVLVATGSVTRALEPLRMAKKLDPYSNAARIGPRTMARRGCIGPTSPTPQSSRSADSGERHAYPS
jgi:hypothetical protein